MGKIITPTYRLEYTEYNSLGLVETHKVAWKSEYGRLNQPNVLKYLRAYERSTQVGGCNSHIGVRQVRTYAAIRQKDNKTMISGMMPVQE